MLVAVAGQKAVIDLRADGRWLNPWGRTGYGPPDREILGRPCLAAPAISLNYV